LRDLLAADKADLDLLLLAAVERAPVDAEVAEKITRTMRDFDATTTLALNGAASAGNTPADLAYALTAAILGLRLRARADAGAAMTGAALFDRLHQPQP
jgi:TetR/AcrR family transcriptional repressor of nem operon